jgi:hypothetical protein
VTAKIATLVFLMGAVPARAQTNAAPSPTLSQASSNSPAALLNQARALAARGEQIRSNCVQNRRYVCGRILKILPDGLVVDSGYTGLLKPPLNRSWLVPGTAVVARDSHLVESNEPDSVCVGLVFVTDIPKSRRLKPKEFDYLVVHAYPAGQRTYTSIGNIHRTVRRYSAGLESAVRLHLQSEADQSHASAAEVK